MLVESPKETNMAMVKPEIEAKKRVDDKIANQQQNPIILE